MEELPKGYATPEHWMEELAWAVRQLVDEDRIPADYYEHPANLMAAYRQFAMMHIDMIAGGITYDATQQEQLAAIKAITNAVRELERNARKAL